MSVKTYVLISNAIACAGFCFLVVNGFPWWGLCCLLFAAYIDNGKKS